MFSPNNLETDPNGLVQRGYDLQSGTAAYPHAPITLWVAA